MTLHSYIEQILKSNKIFKKGTIVNGIAESDNEIYPSAQILGEIKNGECLIVFLEDNSTLAIPLELTSYNESNDLLYYRRKRNYETSSDYEYNYCLIYSYVDLTEEEHPPINPNVMYGIRDDRRISYAPETPQNLLHLNYEFTDSNYYDFPILRYPYYPTIQQAKIEENTSFWTGDFLDFPTPTLAQSIIDNRFTDQLTRKVETNITFQLKTSTVVYSYNPLVPIPPDLIYQYYIILHMNNIRNDNFRIGTKKIRFKYGDEYELELLKLNPYENYKTYINQTGKNRFEVVVKCGVYVDFEGFPKNEYDMEEWFNLIKNNDYIDFNNDDELTEFTWEQLYVYKWSKGYYFVIDKGKIVKTYEYVPTDDYKNFDYSEFLNKGKGIYDRVYACAAAGNWDKYDKDGNPLITKSYYGEDLKYSNDLFVGTSTTLLNNTNYVNEDGTIFYEEKEKTPNNVDYYVLPQLIASEWSNLYTFPDSTTIRNNIPIKKLFETIKDHPVINVNWDVDYGYDNFNSIEKHILKNNPYRNIFQKDKEYVKIFSNLQNNINSYNSAYDMEIYWNDYDYKPERNMLENSYFTQLFHPVTMDYYPHESTNKKIKYFDSIDKPWENNYPETLTNSNEENFAKIEFKVFNLKNKLKYSHPQILNISKFKVTQKDTSNVTSRGDVDLEKFHIKNIYITKHET